MSEARDAFWQGVADLQAAAISLTLHKTALHVDGKKDWAELSEDEKSEVMTLTGICAGAGHLLTCTVQAMDWDELVDIFGAEAAAEWVAESN
jgi:hypothetical protein